MDSSDKTSGIFISSSMLITVLFTLAALIWATVAVTYKSPKCRHSAWKEADCKYPRMCSDCNLTDGEPLGHSWKYDNGDKTAICSVCGEETEIIIKETDNH